MLAAPHPRISLALAISLAALRASGCASSLTRGLFSSSRKIDADSAAKESSDPKSPEAVALRKATADKPPTQEEALASVLADLEKIRAIDPAAEQQVMADLKDANPEYYPLIVQQFRAALAYKQQVAERNAKDTALATSEETRPANGLTDEQGYRHPHQKLRESAARRADSRNRNTDGPNESDNGLAVHVLPSPPASPAAAAQAEAPPEQAAVVSDQPPPVTTAAVAAYPPVPAQTPLPVATLTNPAAGEAQITPASYTAVPPVVESSGDWQADLGAAIAALEKTVKPAPSTVEELHDHMRLRALKLLAGRDDEAYQPIPGASPAQQDYWSKQLFAIDAYLDAAPGRDDRERAAAALVFLDQARAQLSELATLQLRNLAFVASVDGFGAYKPLKATKFQPGQHVTVYAEVENFRSRADADGYHTTLATSYQVLDKSGQRVDGAQFSDIADVCRNRRRDFHMQYDLPLPSRIYPGEYQLELTITDHTSNKIGVSKLRFQIAGEAAP